MRANGKTTCNFLRSTYEKGLGENNDDTVAKMAGRSDFQTEGISQ